MINLSEDVFARCVKTLIDCDEFNSYPSLQAVFTTARLAGFRGDIPVSFSSKRDYVVKTLDFLVMQRAVDGNPLLLVFLEALCARYNAANALYRELKERYFEVEECIGIDVPFVIVAMTDLEASSLFKETVFDSPKVAEAERASFRMFKSAFGAKDFSDWLPRYVDNRNDWSPHVLSEMSIRAFVEKTARHLNLDPRTGLAVSPVHPRFASLDFLAADEDDKRIQAWERLSSSGCIIIIDAISLFHPVIYRMLLQSEMSSNRHVAVAMFVLSPEANVANQLIEQEIRVRLQRAFARFERYDDKLCRLDIRQERDFRRWLVDILLQAPRRFQGVPDLVTLENKWRETPEPRGFADLLLWEG